MIRDLGLMQESSLNRIHGRPEKDDDLTPRSNKKVRPTEVEIDMTQSQDTNLGRSSQQSFRDKTILRWPQTKMMRTWRRKMIRNA